MQLKTITLKNIRSYSSFKINFESGSTLLSGDIGCGKTTILLSLEFSLFGLMKGMLTGSSLLRHGEKEGSVTLDVNIGGKDYKIFRTLKRTSTGIVQDSGFIESAGERIDCTSSELKARILSILGYPDELLSKSKSLIFRYTVYTPQEEMKQIIFDGEDERLEKLTKIFNIEKYKRIKENAENYAKELRAETKIMPVLEKEYTEFLAREKVYEAEMEERSIALQQITTIIQSEEKIIIDTTQKLKETDDAIKTLGILKQEIQILAIQKNNALRNNKISKTEIESLEMQKKKIDEELNAEIQKPNIRSLEEILKDIEHFKKLKEETESKIIEAKSRISLLLKRIDESEKLKGKISSLTDCPTCYREVNDTHKTHICEDEDKKILEYNEKLVTAKTILGKSENNKEIILKKIAFFEKEIQLHREEEQKNTMRKYKEKQKVDIDAKILKFKYNISEGEKDIIFCDKKTGELELKMKENPLDEELVKTLNLKLRESTSNHLKLKVQEGKLIEAAKNITENLEKLSIDKKAKQTQIDALTKKKQTEHWITNHFVNLVGIIEKNVMASIRAEFKEHFEDWFKLLIEDESISATLDDRFNPVISQNGYDTEIENLSGGEKTSVALAYRLALNKVINSMISTIKTKDIIILDEPTDGFSSHQLDKLRDVLDALNAKQTIIVSHEQKMESFVDHIIKLRKHEHASEIMN
jgi:DNA repair protein SbcC/Rad50